MPPLTCWSPLFFYSLLLSELWMSVLTVFPLWTVFNHQIQALWMYSDLSPLVIFLLVCFLHFLSHWLQQHRCTVLVIPASDLISLCIAFFSPAPSPCYSSDHRCVTCMTSVILLTCFYSIFDCLQFTYRPCFSYAFMRSSLVTPKMGARLLNVYSDVCHQWCCAKWTEYKLTLYVFIKL